MLVSSMFIVKAAGLVIGQWALGFLLTHNQRLKTKLAALTTNHRPLLGSSSMQFLIHNSLCFRFIVKAAGLVIGQ
jgi:hypothetical protein